MTNRPWSDPAFFPTAVWLQAPHNAARFKEAGINLYVGLWKGPTAEQLAQLAAVGMPVICEQNETALRDPHREIVAGWMHGDEPDNAQSLPMLDRYGDPIKPETIEADYRRLRAADPSRPVVLNLGQGVAWDQWIGRGVRRNHPEDYPLYLRGCDIASFDIYPVTHDREPVAGKLEFVGRGVARLMQWTEGRKPVWACIECTHISNPERKATPEQVRSEVWLALTHGARGLIYFVHEFKPKFIEAALLQDPVMLAAVKEINAQIREFAPVLNSPTLPEAVSFRTDDPQAQLAVMAKSHAGSMWIFAVSQSAKPNHATFRLKDPSGRSQIEVLGEQGSRPLHDNAWEDDFGPYGVRHYRLPLPTTGG